jgi:hypothetical protein
MRDTTAGVSFDRIAVRLAFAENTHTRGTPNSRQWRTPTKGMPRLRRCVGVIAVAGRPGILAPPAAHDPRLDLDRHAFRQMRVHGQIERFAGPCATEPRLIDAPGTAGRLRVAELASVGNGDELEIASADARADLRDLGNDR